ncbi:MAG: hypothetical protein MRY21_02880 [Simkaniaceae bacterium]|nr:hypothetical protein [Simkaniaceae bacterium]
MKWIFASLIFTFGSCFAASATGVQVYMESPVVQETPPGSVVTTRFIIQNQLNQPYQYQSRFTLPKGWRTVPEVLPPFNVVPAKQGYQVIPVYVPKDAIAGTYKCQYRVQNLSDPGVFDTQDFEIRVLMNYQVETTTSSLPLFLMPGQSYSVSQTLINKGNTDSTFVMEVYDFTTGKVIDKQSYELSPGENKKVPLKLKSSAHITRPTKSRHKITTYIAQAPDIKKVDYVTVEVIPNKTKSTSEIYNTIPSKFEIGQVTNNTRTTGWASLEGQGYINEAQTKHIKYLGKLAFTNHYNISQALGVAPERVYFGYRDTVFDVFLGDGMYTLTPLVINNRYGRGVWVGTHDRVIGIKAMYAHDPPSVFLGYSNIGGTFSINPSKHLSIETTVLNTRPKNLNSPEFTSLKTHYTYSLRSQINYNLKDRPNSIDLEYGSTDALYKNDHEGFNIVAKGEPTPKSWYSGQLLYAGKSFIGTYNDVIQAYTGLGFPITKYLRGVFNFNFIRNNLKKTSQRDGAHYNLNASSQLNFSFPKGFFGNTSLNYREVKNHLYETENHTTSVRANLGQVFDKVTIQGMAELGEYFQSASVTSDSINKQKLSQGYGFYAFYRPASWQNYTIYARLKTENILDKYRYVQTYGFSMGWTLSKALRADLITHITRTINVKDEVFSSLRWRYTFSNKSYITFNGQYIFNPNIGGDSTHQNTYRILTTFTWPFNLPWRKSKKYGGVKGKVTKRVGDYNEPLANFIVHCGEQTTVTNSRGEYSFDGMHPGIDYLWMDNNPQAHVADVTTPLPLEVVGGRMTKQDFQFISEAKLSGTINLYKIAEKDTLEVALREGKKIQEAPSFDKEKPLSQVIVRLESKESDLVYQEPSNSKGRFYFTNMRPGHYTLRIYARDLPRQTYLEKDTFDVFLAPSKQEEMEIRVLPKKRRYRMMESTYQSVKESLDNSEEQALQSHRLPQSDSAARN